jgi:hypothetical protein
MLSKTRLVTVSRSRMRGAPGMGATGTKLYRAFSRATTAGWRTSSGLARAFADCTSTA